MTLRDEALFAAVGTSPRPLNGRWARSTTSGAVQSIQNAHASAFVTTFGDACHNIAVSGATGTGKSASVMLPVASRLIETENPGLILDVKGEYAPLAEKYPERVCLIGGSHVARPFNLIQGMAPELLRAFLFEQLGRFEHRDGAYWGARGVQFAVLVHHFYELREEASTLARLYEALCQPERFIAQFDPWYERQTDLPEGFKALVGDFAEDPFSILALGNSMHYRGPREGTSTRQSEQYAWQTHKLRLALEPFAADPRLRRGLCSEEAGGLDLEQLIYGERRVLVLDLPEDLFGVQSFLASRLLRALFMATVRSYARHDDEGYGTERFTFLVIDEYQHYLNLRSDATSSGLLDDNTWFDRSRSYGHINIVAFQGMASLLARVPPSVAPVSVESLLQNIRTWICFTTVDRHTHEFVARMSPPAIGASVVNLLSTAMGTGEALVFSTHDLHHHGRGLVGHARFGSFPGLPVMGRYIPMALPRLPRDRFELERPGNAETTVTAVLEECEQVRTWFTREAEVLSEELAATTREGLHPLHWDGPHCYEPPNGFLITALKSNRDGTLYVEVEGSARGRAWAVTIPIADVTHLVSELARRRSEDEGAATGIRFTQRSGHGNWWIRFRWSEKNYGQFDPAKLVHETDGSRCAIELSVPEWSWLEAALCGWLQVVAQAHELQPEADVLDSD